MKQKMKKFKEGGILKDEERYGKVGAAIRRLDPEAYKNRPKTLEGNLKLLQELRKKNKEPSSEKDTPPREMSAEEFNQGAPKVRGFDISPPKRPRADLESGGMKRGGSVKKYSTGGSASSRADGCATKGKTKGRFV